MGVISTFFNAVMAFTKWYMLGTVILVTISVIVIKFPDQTIGLFFKFMDKMMLKSAVKDERKHMFENGMGEKSRWEKILNYRIPLPTKFDLPIEITWKDKDFKHIEKVGGKPEYYMNEGTFRSPSPFGSPKEDFMLRKGEEICEFGYFKKKKNENAKTVVFFLPGFGNQGFDSQMRMLGNFCMHQGIDFVTPIAPATRNRKSKGQDKVGFVCQTLIDCPINFHSTILEIRELVRYFGNELKYKNIILSGVSGGAMLAVKVAQILVNFKGQKDIPKIGVLPILPYNSNIPFKELKKTINKNLVGDVPSLFEDEFKKELKNMDSYNKAIEVIKKIEDIPFEEYKNKKSKKFLAKIDFIKLIKARFDNVIPKEMQKETEEEMKDFAKKTGAKFETRSVHCSHFSAFLQPQNHSEFRKEIQKVIGVLEKKKN